MLRGWDVAVGGKAALASDEAQTQFRIDA